MIFVDSGAWFSSLVPSDPDFAAATSWLAQNREPLFTTDFILDETLTLLRVRGQQRRALEFGEHLIAGRIARLHFVSAEDFRAAWDVFQIFADKKWSFTDCTSKAVMERMGLTTAFSFDHHFRQFGTVMVVP